MITNTFTGKIGNQCLQIYKCFLYAMMHNVPYEQIVFTDMRIYNSAPEFFENIKHHFKEDFCFDERPFTVYTNADRRFLLEHAPAEEHNIRFARYSWIYP